MCACRMDGDKKKMDLRMKAENARQQQLPRCVLHRFPGVPRPNKDVDVYDNDGIKYVGKANTGASFIHLYDGTGTDAVHARFTGRCFITRPNATLKPGFEMRYTSPFCWPPPQRGVPRRQQPPPAKVGQHYALIPLNDMLLEDYNAEVERLKVLPCSFKSAAQPKDYEVLEPSDGLMVLVAMALKHMSDAPNDESVQVIAWMHYNTICALDMTFDKLLQQPDLAAWSLDAMEEFEPPDDDPIAASDCWHIEQELRRMLDCHSITEVSSGK